MNTPIVDMLRKYSKEDILRLHMPGHKGRLDSYDITEVEGADSLFDPSGIIKESEENAGSIFGADTFYSTEGSSLSIRAMVYLVTLYAKEENKTPVILAARNAHKSFISAVALCDARVEWLLSNKSGSYLSCPVTPEEVEREIKDKRPTAVYLTSPDYLGTVADVEGIAKVCKKEGVLLLVDNAHGAYLKFLKPSRHPIDLGADLCCDSAHKTLEVLGGGGYLHVSKNAQSFFSERAKEAMSLFASTSPSYLILASLDKVNEKLFGEYSSVLTSFIDILARFKRKIEELGYTNTSDEPLKITIDAKQYGYTGRALADELLKRGIVCEFSDNDYLVMMLSPYMTEQELSRLYEAFRSIPRRNAIAKTNIPYSLPKRMMSPRDAVFSKSIRLKSEDCLGMVLASVTVACPPAVPIIVSGEVIDEDTIEAAKYYGIEYLTVVKV